LSALVVQTLVNVNLILSGISSSLVGWGQLTTILSMVGFTYSTLSLLTRRFYGSGFPAFLSYAFPGMVPGLMSGHLAETLRAPT
jgi:hypothetical protein